MQQFETAREAALALRPDDPVYCFRPEVLQADASAFMAMFPGKTAYAVKTNGEPIVLEGAGRGRRRLLRRRARPASSPRCAPSRPNAELLYMHPVKAQSDIRAGARELRHPRHRRSTMRTRSPSSSGSCGRSTSIPATITLFVRLQTKGLGRLRAVEEIRRRRRPMRSNSCKRIDRIGFKVGLCFHVGSQIEDPDTYERALASADWVRNRAGVAARRASTSAAAFRPLRPRPQPHRSR